MAPDAVGTKEGSNIEEKVVAELLSKLDAKCNLKVVACLLYTSDAADE